MSHRGLARTRNWNVRHGLSRLALGAGAVALLAVPGTAHAQDRLLGQGSWSWFAEPRAVNYGGRTFVGWVDWQGHVNVGAYDQHSGGSVTVALFQHVDDHDSPSLSVNPDGRLTVFFSHHAGSHIYYRVSERPLDITSWGPEMTVPARRVGTWGNTYPTPLRLPAAGGPLWLFWRGSDWSTFFSIQRGAGGWSSPRRMIRVPGQRPYVKYATDGGGTIHMAFTRSHPREGRTGVYYAKYRRGAFYRASGRRIRSVARLPFRPREATMIYDDRRHRASGWVHDIGLGADGRPVVVYAVVHSRRRHSYRYARWTGRRWVDGFIVRAGGTISTTPREWAYSGGISLDKRDPSVAYLSRRVGGVNELERWHTPNGGMRWTHSAITHGSRWGNYRPVVPLGTSPGAGGDLLWLSGYYGTYRTFRTWVNMRSEAPSPPPLVAFRAAHPAGGTSRQVVLKATVIKQAPSPPVSLEWQLGDGGTAFGRSVTHRYESPGRYFPRLVVRDADGAKGVHVREVRAGR